MNTTGFRPTPPLLVIARAVHDEELARLVLDSLYEAGFRVVPLRRSYPVAAADEPDEPEEPRYQEAALMREGQIASRQLIEAAADFDRIADPANPVPFVAADFVAWLLPEVRGSPERKWLEARRMG